MFSLSLCGTSENIITLGTLLARGGWPIGAIFMPERFFALASVLLLGCPAYDNLNEALEATDTAIIEDTLLEQVTSQLAVCSKDSRNSGRLIIAVHFANAADNGPMDKLEKSSLPNSAAVRFLWLNIWGKLPSIGQDIVQVQERSQGSHEPNPSRDYELNCRGISCELVYPDDCAASLVQRGAAIVRFLLQGDGNGLKS